MHPLRVLITNLSLTARSGTETYVRDLACRLLRLGHAPVVYSPLLGEVARELRAATVRVLDDLDGLEPPDVIHGHHHPELMTALLRFPGVPAVFVCHSRDFWFDGPPSFPRIRRHVAVDDDCRERLAVADGVREDQIRVILNAVDLERFRPRPPLPSRPRRALVFSHYAAEHTHLPAVREACARAGLELDVRGNESGRPCARPEEVLGGYDLVFAKARCALEALAVGAAVVLCDFAGAGPLVRAADVDRLRRLNFGRRALDRPLAAETLLAEMARYDAADAAEASRRVRAAAGLDEAVASFVALYHEVVAEQAAAGPADAAAELRDASAYLSRLMPFNALLAETRRADRKEQECRHWWQQAQRLHAEAEAARTGWQETHAEAELLRAGWERTHAEAARAQEGWRRAEVEAQRAWAAVAARHAHAVTLSQGVGGP
jgi:hypothetical protein